MEHVRLEKTLGTSWHLELWTYYGEIFSLTNIIRKRRDANRPFQLYFFWVWEMAKFITNSLSNHGRSIKMLCKVHKHKQIKHNQPKSKWEFPRHKHRHKKDEHVPFSLCYTYVAFVSSENEDEISTNTRRSSMTALWLCLILRLRLSLCFRSGVLTCFSANYADANVTYACAYVLVKTSLQVLAEQVFWLLLIITMSQLVVNAVAHQAVTCASFCSTFLTIRAMTVPPTVIISLCM